MIRLLLYSRNAALRAEIAFAPGSGFHSGIDSNRERIRSLVLSRKCDVVLIDFEHLAEFKQFAFLEELENLGMPVVVLISDDPRERREVMRLGVRNLCARPVDLDELSSIVRKILEHDLDAAAPSPKPDELIGVSPAAAGVKDLIRRVAGINAFVLITGETGTGKELIAKAIHRSSARAPEPFVAVSCGAIPESLIEAELFGSEKGAFTGADTRRTGYFEEAGAGTLFLDEIGEISAHTQIRLLRVLQQREFTRLGSSTAIPLRARVVFATNRNLKQMVAEGTFREDLYYRLNVVAIESQPLRNRRDDIPLLARHLLALHAENFGKAVTHIEPAAMAALCQYSWPGNVRELENVIQRAIVMTNDDAIHESDLPEDLQQDETVDSPDALQWLSFEARLVEYKMKLALDAIKECNGNKTLAAQSLNISRTYLHRLIRGPGEFAAAAHAA